MISTRHRRQTATYWELDGRGFGSPVVFRPGDGEGGVRWQQKLTLIRDEQGRKAAQEATVVVPGMLSPGAAIAEGDHSLLDPLDVAGIHEVIGCDQSLNLRGNRHLYRAKARPLYGLLQDTVTVYAVDRVQDGRGYSTQRGDILYQGPANVSAPDRPQRTEYAGQNANEWDTLVTIPMRTSIRSASRMEIVWDGPVGETVLDAIGPVWGSDWSPLWVGIASVLRRSQT